MDSIEHGTLLTSAATNTRVQADRIVAGADDGRAACAALAQARAGARSKLTLAKAEEAVVAHGENIARAIRDGVKIAFGTDSGVSDHGKNAKEFALLVKAGMRPPAAIARRRSTPRRRTIAEAGKDADIIAVTGQPARRRDRAGADAVRDGRASCTDRRRSPAISGGELVG